MNRGEGAGRAAWMPWILISLFVLTACSSRPPAAPLPKTITADFFPLTLGSWWEFESVLPGFPDRPLRDRFLLQAPDEEGRYPVSIKTLSIVPGVPPGDLRLERREGGVRMYRDLKPVDLLRIGARVGDTWPFNPARPQYLAHLKDIRYEEVLGEWRPVAVVEHHAGGLSAEVVRQYGFARGIGWTRIVQKRVMGSVVRTTLVKARVVPRLEEP